MQSIRIAGNYIAEFDSPSNPNRGLGQLQLVLHDQNSLSREIEVSRPVSNLGPAPWQFDEQLHGGPTPYIGWNDAVQNPNRYAQMELDLRPGTTAEGTWELIGQITASLARQGFAIDYNAGTQNENSFVASVLSVVGIDIADLPVESYTPIDVRSFAGIETNIFEDGVEPLFASQLRPVNLEIAGTNHTDYIQGGAGNDILKGGFFGLDTIKGGGGNDTITGSYQDNRLLGGEGNDTIDGSWGNDTSWGGVGDDIVAGGAGNDAVVGGSGNDTVMGNSGADDLFGSGGNDNIFGGRGNDDIIGGDGMDVAFGGSGNDTFYDGRGSDTYTGDSGSDTFVFYSGMLQCGSLDRVTDFDSGTDKLIFSNITSYRGNTISSGRDADTNGDGKISALDEGWFNTGSDGLIFYDENYARIQITMTDGTQELQLYDFI